MVSALGVCLFLSGLLAADGPRNDMSLSGSWEYQRVGELGELPTAGRWSACSVPGYLSGTSSEHAWVRRAFTLPAAMRGQRLKLRFNGVKYNSRVYVNGQHVGGCFGGYEPFEIDVTSAVRWDGPNELAVGCHDWTGVFTPGEFKFPAQASWDALRSAPADRILSPIGGLYGLFGIWDEVTLQAYPAVHVQDVFVKPSVRQHELVADYRLGNESDNEVRTILRVVVEDAGQEILQFDPVEVLIPAGQSVTLTVRKSWANPPLWSHLDPHLLTLRTTLDSGDQLRTRFGFREFWVEGDKFFLNGVRTNLLATSWWPPHDVMDREAIRKTWESVKRMGCVAFRTHTQPWPALHYDVADEVGLLMIIEGAVWNDDDTYRIFDPRFWANYESHLRTMVAQHKNRPSVVMWSLENEFFGGRLHDTSPAKPDLVRMGRVVKECDPTRPIFFESDGDPDGIADCIGIHYPHEYPDYTCWPNEVNWLREPAKIPHMFLNGAASFVWQHDKPLYVGEFLWIPSSDPSWHTVFFGDEAYRDYPRYRNLAKAESWKMQILGYRDLEVGGMSPWTAIEGGPLDETNPLFQAHQYAYQPIAAYPLEYDTRFYSQEHVARRLAVFNDAMESSKFLLRSQLTIDARTIHTDEMAVELAPGQRTHVDVMLPMPVVTQPQSVVMQPQSVLWTWQMERRGQIVFQDRRNLTVCPTPVPPIVRARIGLYDPAQTTRAVFDKLQRVTHAVDSLEQLPEDLDLLILGAGSLQPTSTDIPVIGAASSPRKSLIEFAKRGGRVLVLRQTGYPTGLFDVSLTGQRSTMTFAQTTRHPALRGLTGDDLRFWRDDHIVATHELTRPVAGALPIVVSGSAAGVDTSPLVVQPVGPGCLVFCQMLLVEKFDREPVAARLLINLINWLANYQASTGTTAVVGPPEYAARLRSLGLQSDDWSAACPAGDWSTHRLLIWRQEPQDLVRLRQFVEQGGTVWLHRLPWQRVGSVAAELGIPLEAQSFRGPVSRAESDDPLLDFITREDLYWLGRHEGIGWDETPRADHMADAVFSKSLSGKSVANYEVEDWKLTGGIVDKRPPGVVFATVGQASHTINFSTSGDHLIGVHARGTPAAGVFPLVRIAIDGVVAGTVGTTDQWQTTTISASIEAGPHDVSVAFVNDGSNPPLEDRNLYVDRLVIAPDDGRDGVTFLTTPAALAVSRLGRGMIVWDQLAWDTEEPNARKATRLAGSLLTALGAEFTPRIGTVIEAEGMTPQPGMPYFSNTGTCASLACSGFIATPVRVVAPGKYLLELTAAGSSAAGIFPTVDVLIDQLLVGTIQLTSTEFRTYWLGVELPQGEHEMRLAFTNDLNVGGEDRNLQLDKVSVYRE